MPGERLADAPEQILQREREGEDVAAPVIGVRQRREEEAERRARPEAISAIRQPKPTISSGVRHVAQWRAAAAVVASPAALALSRSYIVARRQHEMCASGVA